MERKATAKMEARQQKGNRRDFKKGSGRENGRKEKIEVSKREKERRDLEIRIRKKIKKWER